MNLNQSVEKQKQKQFTAVGGDNDHWVMWVGSSAQVEPSRANRDP